MYIYKHEWYIKNKEKLIKKAKEYRIRNKELIAKRRKEFRKKNPELIALQKKKYANNNLDKISLYRRNKIKNDIQFKLAARLRSRMGNAIKRNSKLGSSVKDLGCSILELKFYLEGKFKDGMSWDNYGTKWHIDHVIPLTFFDLTNREQFLKACHYTNLQPLWAKENLIKGNRVVLSTAKPLALK